MVVWCVFCMWIVWPKTVRDFLGLFVMPKCNIPLVLYRDELYLLYVFLSKTMVTHDLWVRHCLLCKMLFNR